MNKYLVFIFFLCFSTFSYLCFSQQDNRANGKPPVNNHLTEPEFKGGKVKLDKYLRRHLRYPARAKKNKIEGSVFVSFIVENNGDLTNFKVEKGIGYGCDEAALKAIKKMHSWKPGTDHGVATRMKMTLPVTFELKKTGK